LMDVERKVQLLTLEDMDKKQHEEITDESYLLNIDKIFLPSLNVYFSQDYHLQNLSEDFNMLFLFKLHDKRKNKICIYPSVGIIHPKNSLDITISNYPTGSAAPYKLSQKMTIKTIQVEH